FELAGFGIVPLGVYAFEEETFDFISRVQGVAVALELLLGEIFQYAANIGGVHSALLLDDIAEDHDFAGAEEIGGRPVEGGQSIPRRRSLSFCAVKPRMDEPSKVRLSQLFSRNF